MSCSFISPRRIPAIVKAIRCAGAQVVCPYIETLIYIYIYMYSSCLQSRSRPARALKGAGSDETPQDLAQVPLQLLRSHAVAIIPQDPSQPESIGISGWAWWFQLRDLAVEGCGRPHCR